MAGNRAVQKPMKSKSKKKNANNNRARNPNHIPSVAPLAMDTSRPQVSMSFKTPSHRGSEGRVTGIDYVGTFDSATSFTLTSLNLNPRISAVFPRLSGISTVWRRYYFRKLRFHLFGINAATQSGYVAMSSLVTDDLATLVTPSTEAQVLNMENLAIGRPWSYVIHTVNLGGLGLEWYTTDVSASSSEFGEAIGRAFLALPLTPSAGDIRVQLYVEYDVEFCQRISSDLVTSCVAGSLAGGRIQAGGTTSSANLLGDSAVVDPQAVGISIDSSGVITFSSAGQYLLGFLYTVDLTTGPGTFPRTGLSGYSQPSANQSGSVRGIIRCTAAAGATLGPLAHAGATILSPCEIYIARAPDSSLTEELENVQHNFPQIKMCSASKPLRY